MAINHFIPTIWSEHLYKSLDKRYIGAAHCSREFEGEIKEKGSKVKITGLSTIDVRDYTRNSNMQAPQNLSDHTRELVIDKAKYFNFQVDDIDKMQALPMLMGAALQNAANSLANEVDCYIFSLYNGFGNYVETSNEDPAALMSAILDARTLLYRNDVMENEEIVLEITPDVAAMLLRANIELQTDNRDLLETGCIGRLFGVKVFVSNNIYCECNETPAEGAPDSYHKCIMRTTRAIAYANQLSEIEAYRPELRFADAIKGLHLFGAKVIQPGEGVVIDVAMYNEL